MNDSNRRHQRVLRRFSTPRIKLPAAQLRVIRQRLNLNGSTQSQDGKQSQQPHKKTLQLRPMIHLK